MLASSGSILSKKLQGSLINASKPIRVLNRLAGSGTMLAWYQGKPIGVLNRPVGSKWMLSKNLQQGSSINASKPIRVLNMLASNETMLAWYQDKPIGVLNRFTSSGEISGKRALVNAPLGTCVNNKICLGRLFFMSLKNHCKMDLDPIIWIQSITRICLS